MPETGTPPGSEGPALHDKKLVSWKEIASHLGREVRTVQRWEKSEGLPVRRHEHRKKCTVYAYASELDGWFRKRRPADDPEADAAFEPEPDVLDAPAGSENGDVVFTKDSQNSGDKADSTSSDDSVQSKPRRRKRLMAPSTRGVSASLPLNPQWLSPGNRSERLAAPSMSNMRSKAACGAKATTFALTCNSFRLATKRTSGREMQATRLKGAGKR